MLVFIVGREECSPADAGLRDQTPLELQGRDDRKFQAKTGVPHMRNSQRVRQDHCFAGASCGLKSQGAGSAALQGGTRLHRPGASHADCRLAKPQPGRVDAWANMEREAFPAIDGRG